MSDNFEHLFDEVTVGEQRLRSLLDDPSVAQIVINRHDSIFYSDHNGPQKVAEPLFAGPAQYVQWLDQRLLPMTDAGYTSVDTARTSVIEASFRPDEGVRGSVHIATKEVTRDQPVLTVRKQPLSIVTLDRMVSQRMLTPQMATFLELCVRGRANLLISGGSGAGKTTMVRALAQYVDPEHRIISCEEIEELHLNSMLPNAVALTTYRLRDEQGGVIRETTLADLVKETLRMRPDRVWVGEVRGAEAYSLVKACNSGHSGSTTTVHGDDGAQAVRQLVTYVMETGLAAETAQEQVAQAFQIVVQINKLRPDLRVVTEISELEPVTEGSQQRRNVLFRFDEDHGVHVVDNAPTPGLQRLCERFGVDLMDAYGQGR